MISRIPEYNVSVNLGTLGTVVHGKRMLGDAGATGAVSGDWFRQNALWKTFLLYSLDRKTALGALVDVKVDGCMELAAVPANSAYVELGSLSQAVPRLSLEEPWRYVRARVVNAGGGTIQVGLHAQGQ